MPKRIKVAAEPCEVALEFTGRGPGEETPYYQGVILAKQGRKWERIGDFHNEGCGGATFVSACSADGKAIIEKLTEAVKEAFAAVGIESIEPEGEIVAWAELIGYDLHCTAAEFSLQDYVALTWCRPRSWDIEAKTDEQTAAFEAADTKAKTITASQHAKKGKTAVFLADGENMLIFKSRDRDAIVASLERRGESGYRILA